jgi:hypothetical protein
MASFITASRGPRIPFTCLIVKNGWSNVLDEFVQVTCGYSSDPDLTDSTTTWFAQNHGKAEGIHFVRRIGNDKRALENAERGFQELTKVNPPWSNPRF